MRRARKWQALLLTISVMVGIVASAIPAQAAPVGNVNLISSRTVRSGAADQQFTFAVANTAPQVLGSTINHIVVVPPGGFSTDLGTTPLSGWTITRSSNGQIVFDGGALAPSSSGNFTVQADAAIPAFDLTRTWKLFASDDGGKTLTQMPLSTANGATMSTAIKTLEVLSVTVTGPSGVLDNTATEAQEGIQVRTRITNMGSAAQTVTPTIGGRAITVQQAPAAQSIVPGAIQDFDFVVKIGNKSDYTCTGCGNGNVTFSGGGTAENSSAIGAAATPVAVMTRVVGSFVTNTLAPRGVAANRAYEFALSIEKDGEAAAANLTGTAFSFAGGAFSAGVASPTSIVGGNDQATRLTFASTVVPGSITDGDYADAKLLFTGTDENGAPFNQTINVTDSINVDSLIPAVTATISGPASRTSAPPAVKNGSTVNLRAVVTDGSANAPCGACTIADAYLQQFNGGTELARIPVTLGESANPLETGVFTGTYNGDYATNATAIQLVVVAADPADNTGSNTSSLLDVDNIAPGLVGAATGAGAKNRLLVSLSEIVAVNGAMAPTDWNVQGYTVASAQLQPDGQSVVLTTTQNVADNATPVIQYTPSQATRAFDRVDNKLANQALNAVDGIVPAAPLLAAIAGGERNSATGAFHTNSATPRLTFGNEENPVGAGHRVEVFEDLNDNGALDVGEPSLGAADATGDTVVVALSSLGTEARQVNLVSRALDANNNSSELADSALQLDFIEPNVAAVARLAGDVTVTFTEQLSGNRSRDFATDWTLHDRTFSDRNFWMQFKPNSVDGGGTDTQTLTRTLHVSDGEWATATLTHLEYEYLGGAGARYVDLAGNELVNFFRAL
jgi:hypothetical protein